MTQADTSIQAQHGVPFEVAILASPGTGYLWSLHDHPAEISFLKEAAAEQSQDAPVAGGTSTQLFQLVADTPGQYTLVFELRRPWEAEGVRRHTVHVDVS